MKRLMMAWRSFALFYGGLNYKTKRQITTKEDVHDSWFLHQDLNPGLPGYKVYMLTAHRDFCYL